MKYYIYTVPKAGTYLLAVLLEKAGVHNTGYHIKPGKYLDTKAAGMNDNISSPSRQSKESPSDQLLDKIAEGSFLFGHMTPFHFRKDQWQNLNVLLSIRDPKEVVESEFIDFRFRRDDIQWVSKEVIKDDTLAFEHYLQKNLIHTENIFREMHNFYNKIATKTLPNDANLYILNFKEFLNKEEGLKILQKIIDLFKLDTTAADMDNLYDEIINEENKTKTVNEPVYVDKEILWSDKARAIFDQSDVTSTYETLLSFKEQQNEL
ncbi:hypothetical protein [Sulfurimonas sp. HSL-1716]|uniref:hypothetical protein n=1 Tax=Hydrocurvibacter sulfurireducens TaxID=3131937 RepID=UPI0031F8308A